VLIHAAVDNDIHPPRFGGAQRSFGLARGLARHHRVRVLCVVPNRNAAPADETRDGVELLRRKAWQTSVAWRLERWGLAPLFSAERGHRANAARYASVLGAGADVLAADLNLAGLLARTDARLRVHTSHNVETDRFAASRPRLLARSRWAERLRRLEREAVERAHLTVVCTDEDAARMRELHGASPDRLVVIPNGYDETELRPPSADERARARAALGIAEPEYVVAFVGADWGPNREALAVLLERVMPALAREGFRLLVAGSVARALPSRRERWLLSAGELPSLLPVLHAADAGANPVSAGGGSNVKVPTYLAAGLAVVTTPFGVRGYAPLAPLCVVADADGFADALRARPRGTAARGEPSPAALVDYAWGRLGERLGERCAARLAGPSGASARGAA
jgi:glycosyltransferase involved in cell wall biosynthesis